MPNEFMNRKVQEGRQVNDLCQENVVANNVAHSTSKAVSGMRTRACEGEPEYQGGYQGSPWVRYEDGDLTLGLTDEWTPGHMTKAAAHCGN